MHFADGLEDVEDNNNRILFTQRCVGCVQYILESVWGELHHKKYFFDSSLLFLLSFFKLLLLQVYVKKLGSAVSHILFGEMSLNLYFSGQVNEMGLLIVL